MNDKPSGYFAEFNARHFSYVIKTKMPQKNQKKTQTLDQFQDTSASNYTRGRPQGHSRQQSGYARD